MGDLAWLTARPIAHRGLHDAAAGIVENTPTAVDAAMAAGFAVEIDLQPSADGVPMVFHDATLDRLTIGRGPLNALMADALAAVPFKASADRMMRLDDLLARVAGRVPLLIELKSVGDTAYAAVAARRVADYAGPAALMSFDPALLAVVRRHAPDVPRGIVAEYRFAAAEWPGLSRWERLRRRYLLHWPVSRFQFVAHDVRSIDRSAIHLARAFGLPVLAWTVRTAPDRARATRAADQIIFEGWRP